MGGCATKPKVLKDSTDKEGKKAPEPIKEEAAEAGKLVAAERKVVDKPLVVDQEIVDADDDQANRRRSLSSLFKDKQNEDGKILTVDEKSPVEEKKEAEANKSSQEIKRDEAVEKKSTGETTSNEKVKQLEAQKKTAETSKEKIAEASGSSDLPDKETEKPADKFEEKSTGAGNSEATAEKKSTGETKSNEAVKQLEAEKKAAETAKEKIAEASGSSDLPAKETEKPAEKFEEKSPEAENSATTAAEVAVAAPKVATDKEVVVGEAADAGQVKNQTVDSASKPEVKH